MCNRTEEHTGGIFKKYLHSPENVAYMEIGVKPVYTNGSGQIPP